jgi:hypothetical protein
MSGQFSAAAWARPKQTDLLIDGDFSTHCDLSWENSGFLMVISFRDLQGFSQ